MCLRAHGLDIAELGDAGGVLLIANEGRGEQPVYTDARELLEDVLAAQS